MDAREFLEIVKKEHRKRMPGCETKKYGICPFFVGGQCQCTADVWNTGIKDPVAIAEEIKAEQDKPKPAKQFERGKHYRFSAKLFWENVENKYLFESTVIKNWVNKCDGEDIDKLEYKDTVIKPEWCYEVPAEKPQLPKKTLIIYDSTWPNEVEIYFEHLNDRVNAIIDYLKARENND